MGGSRCDHTPLAVIRCMRGAFPGLKNEPAPCSHCSSGSRPSSLPGHCTMMHEVAQGPNLSGAMTLCTRLQCLEEGAGPSPAGQEPWLPSKCRVGLLSSSPPVTHHPTVPVAPPGSATALFPLTSMEKLPQTSTGAAVLSAFEKFYSVSLLHKFPGLLE